VHAALAHTAEALGLGLGKIAQPLRVAITGTQVSPSIEYTVYLAGREQALLRIDAALELIAPAIFAYVLSFATIGLYWLGHWRRYRYIERIDERLVGLNLVQLALVAFIPFPTAMMGDHGDLALVVAIYALSLSAAWVLGPLTWLYAWRAGLVRAGVAAGYVRLAAMRGVAVPLVMLASLPFMPLIGPSRIGLTWILIVPVQIVLSRLTREHETHPLTG